MPVTVTETVAIYSGNGNTVDPYPITIPRNRDEDLHLLVDGVETTDFTVSPDGFRTGVGYGAGVSLTLYRVTPQTQIQPFPSNTTPAAESVRAGLDKVTLLIQENTEALERSLKSPIGTSFPPSSTIGVDALGDPVGRTAAEEVVFLGIGTSVEIGRASCRERV